MIEFQKVILDSLETLSVNSDIHTIDTNKKYVISTQYIGKKGKKFCAYFGVIILDKSGKEIDRKVRWLNDFSGVKKEATIIFKPHTNKIIIIYRMNIESPMKSNCNYNLLPIEKVSVTPVKISMKNKGNVTSKLDFFKKFEDSYDLVQDYIESKTKELTPEEELTLEKNLVWLFGSPRSGTTWLGTQLLSTKTHTMLEPRIGRLIIPITEKINNKKQDYFFSDHYKKTWSFFLRKLILNRIYSQFKDLSKKIIIKDPNASFGAMILTECMPYSKILILLRDGKDVIDSLVDGRAKNGWVTKLDDTPPLSDSRRKSFIQFQSEIWVATMEIIMKAYNSKPEDLRYILKYEKLRKNPQKELEKIFRFLEIGISRQEIEKVVEKYSFENIPKNKKGKGKFTRRASPGKWRVNFSKEEQDLMEKIMGKCLQKLKYA